MSSKHERRHRFFFGVLLVLVILYEVDPDSWSQTAQFGLVLYATAYVMYFLYAVVASAIGMFWPRTRPDPERCKKCGYCLRGLSPPRCPECGTPFEMSLLEDGHSKVHEIEQEKVSGK